MKKIATDVDAYIAAAPKEARAKLVQLRKLIRAAAPTAKEIISYGMPYYRQNGAIAGFAAFRTHVSLFGAVTEEQRRALRGYETGKGTVRFPLDKPLPAKLIVKMIRGRVERNDKRRSDEGGRRGPRLSRRVTNPYSRLVVKATT